MTFSIWCNIEISDSMSNIQFLARLEIYIHRDLSLIVLFIDILSITFNFECGTLNGSFKWNKMNVQIGTCSFVDFINSLLEWNKKKKKKTQPKIFWVTAKETGSRTYSNKQPTTYWISDEIGFVFPFEIVCIRNANWKFDDSFTNITWIKLTMKLYGCKGENIEIMFEVQPQRMNSDSLNHYFIISKIFEITIALMPHQRETLLMQPHDTFAFILTVLIHPKNIHNKTISLKMPETKRITEFVDKTNRQKSV